MITDADRKYLVFSIAGHLALLLILTVKIYLFPGQREFVRSIRVDLVALPDKNPIEAPKGKEETATPTESAKPEVKKEDKPQPKPEPKNEKPKEKTAPKSKKSKPKPKPKENTAAEQKNALERLKALQKIKKLKAEKQGSANTTQYKGNIKSEGTSLTGVEKLQHDRYLEELDGHIKEYWELPAFLENSDNLSAVLLIKINEQGQIIAKTLIRSSGNHVYDQRVIQAVESASPLPTPPESLASYLKFNGIELRFPE